MRNGIEPHDSFQAAVDIGTDFILDVGAGPEISALRALIVGKMMMGQPISASAERELALRADSKSPLEFLKP